jgi:hypothetical protein
VARGHLHRVPAAGRPRLQAGRLSPKQRLGVRLYEQQDYAGARAAHQIAIDAGDEALASRALMNMSVLLREHRDVVPDQVIPVDHPTELNAD